jgi:hypothetical protein
MSEWKAIALLASFCACNYFDLPSLGVFPGPLLRTTFFALSHK